jgi:hypothetical protein
MISSMALQPLRLRAIVNTASQLEILHILDPWLGVDEDGVYHQLLARDDFE